MQIGKLSVLFYRYFYNKVDAFKYDNALKLLQKVEQFKQLDCSNEWLIEFTKKYYEMKEWVENTYNHVQKYEKSIEGMGLSLIKRRKLYFEQMELAEIYRNCTKFENRFFDTYGLSLINVKDIIVDEEKKNNNKNKSSSN